MHVTDWFPTLLRMSGCEVPEETLPLDGAAQDIFHKEPELKRHQILQFMDPLKVEDRQSDNRTFAVLSNRAFDVTVKAAIRSENWKLITGRPCHSGCSFSTKERNPKYITDRVSLDDVESKKLVRLYKITEDPIERHDLSDLFPEIVDKFLVKLADYYDEQRKPQNEKRDHRSTPLDGVWRPWLKKEKYVYKSFTGIDTNRSKSTFMVSEALKNYADSLEHYEFSDGTVVDF